ncbi:FUSC family protein [Streptomyces sioyaensis]|uniref:FUSC family protein n=1 Tax=Streptomyces sioyaensis TaxID=67364 RepID=UPI0037CE0955
MTHRPTFAATLRIYLSRESKAHYHWRFGILVSAIVAAPLIVGELTGSRTGGVIGALAAWFIALALPPRSAFHRLLFLGRRLLILTATSALGVLTGHHLFWTAAVIIVLALMIPVPGMTITPLITFIMATNAPHGLTSTGYIGAFFLGGAAALLALLLPIAASPVAPTFTGLGIEEPWRRLVHHCRGRSPEVRYAAQAAVCICVGYLVLTALHWPHAGWVLVGVLTTLRPSWGATEARVVKRSIGMIGGAMVTAVFLLVSAHAGYWITVVCIAVLGGLARPLRQYNYGYWPVLGTPVLLLLTNLEEPLTAIDSVWRLGNNILGAAITLFAITCLWPHDTQRPAPSGLPESGGGEDRGTRGFGALSKVPAGSEWPRQARDRTRQAVREHTSQN